MKKKSKNEAFYGTTSHSKDHGVIKEKSQLISNSERRTWGIILFIDVVSQPVAAATYVM